MDVIIVQVGHDVAWIGRVPVEVEKSRLIQEFKDAKASSGLGDWMWE